jgi:hypothetical protein
VTARPLVMAALAAVALAAALGGCADAKRPAAPAPPRAYHPERFPDIPLPPGFMLAPGHDQLAVAMAGGMVRRFEVWMVEKPGGTQATRPGEVLAWYDQRLPGLGWRPALATVGERRFRRLLDAAPGEELTILASASMSGTTVEFHLAPIPAAAPAP